MRETRKTNLQFAGGSLHRGIGNCQLAILGLAVAAAVGAEMKPLGSPAKASVSVVRRVDVDYYLLTRGSGLEFEVDAGEDSSVWLRVYTRLWWPANATGPQRYGLSLWRGELERPYEFETEASGSSRTSGGRAVGAWRSFFVQVPSGKSRLRLTLGEDRQETNLQFAGGSLHRAAETVGVRFAFQPPRPWRSLALAGLRELELVQAQSDDAADARRPAPRAPGPAHPVRTYYEARAGRPVRVRVAGPSRLRVRVRLNYDAALLGQQTCLLTLRKGGQTLAEQVLTVSRSLSARFLNASDLVPSTEDVVRLDLPAGEHELTAVVSGMLARSAAVAIEVLVPEKYE